jgi:class 3 adenylate cyclase/tetratricopeptide (TPR) repeat protein
MTTCVRCGAELPEGARFCPACGAPVEAAPPAAEERKLATVLFGDLVGSTELGASQDPERTRAMLDRFYDAMAAEVESAGGTLEKFAGDAVMAAFGVPAAHEDHGERALHCALSMQRRLQELFGDELSLRIGVNTGDVIVGRPREGSSFATGDAVNVAARLEQAAAPGEILVGERTVAAVRGAFEFAEPTTVEAKGKAGGVVARRLVRALSLMRPRGVRGLRDVFVGRESELGLLQATYERVASERRPHVVTVMGDSGVGKTRLMRELWDWLGGESPEPLRRTGRCLPYGDGITYWPLGEVLKEHLGLLESDSAETALQHLGPRRILGLTIGLDVAGDLHPLAARDRLHEAWVDFLSQCASEQPLVVLVEDLHWAEQELLDLLERLVRDVDGALLLLGTARPELLDGRPTWGAGRRNASLLWLEPLPAQESARLLSELLAGELPPATRELLVERSEGNPFFVEELLGTLIDRGFVTRQNGSWTIHELPDDFTVPDSVQAVLSARIDLLGPTEKAALQAASVVGRVFWTGPVCELLDGGDPDFDLLEERDFIRHRSGSSMAGEREYVIKHALTREVAYGSLPKARRARMHAAFAQWLEQSGEGRDDFAPLLAHHYAEAVRAEDVDLAWADAPGELGRLRRNAIAWLRRAAELAVARYEIDEALTLLHRGLALEPDAELQSDLWAEVGHANALKYDGEAFWTAMQKALQLCSSRSTCADRYSELAWQTATRGGMWKRRPDMEAANEWARKAIELAEPESRAHVKGLLADAVLSRSPASGREASVLAERLGDAELRSHAWDVRRFNARVAGDHEQALEWWQRRFELLGEISDPDHVADIYESGAPSCVALGRFREARRLARLFEELTSGLTVHHRMHGVAVLLETETMLGGWETIRKLQDRAEQAADANGATPCIRNATAPFLCAIANAYLGNDAEARRLEERADAAGMEGWRLLDIPRVRLALIRGELDRAEELLARDVEGVDWFGLISTTTRLDALAALRDRRQLEAEAPAFLKRNPYLEPFALRALGVVREDESIIEQALTRFEALKLDWHAAETRKLLTASS